VCDHARQLVLGKRGGDQFSGDEDPSAGKHECVGRASRRGRTGTAGG
jgi:hypothetical protein